MIKTDKRDKIDIISFTVNKINALITEDIREEINRLSSAPSARIIIDLTGVEYIDSSGFSLFLSVMKSVRNNYGILKFANPDPRVMEVFRMLHLDTVFMIFDDLDACVRSFK